MKKRNFKISLLALLLVLVLSFGVSCSLLSSLNQSVCTHDKVYLGDCKTPGECALCGKAVGTLGDHYYEGKVVYPDCANGGYTEYVCKTCSDSYKENFTDPDGHKFGEWVFSKDPTATEDGEMYRECSVCKAKETESVPAHVHSIASASAKAATCTSDGWEAYEYCTLCEYSTKTVIKAIGHAWGNYVSNGDSTHYRVCGNDASHVATDPCSGGDASGSSLPICQFCNTAYDFAARAGNSAYGYHVLGTYATYGSGMQKLYKEFTKTCEKFLVSDENVALDGTYYVIGTYDLDDYGLTIDAGSAVWKIFYVSSPVYYWLDAKIVTRGSEILLTIADDYARASDRREADADIAAMTEEFAPLISDGMTDLEKTMTISKYIVENMEYAYEADGTTPVSDMWAHCMAGFASHGYGVCEAYAKTFMYLCLLNGIDCRTGSGYAGGEAHAWNYVKIDSEWYGVDLTWTDNSGDEAVYDYFGLSSTIFATHQSHQSATPNGDFIYAPPTLAHKGIEPTALYENGEYVGMYKSIDDAFAAMTDSNAEYEINIGYFGFFVSSPAHTIRSTSTPDVKKLTITGKNLPGEGNVLDNNSLIHFFGALTLGSDVELKNLHLLTADGAGVCPINLNGHTLTLGGNTVYMDNRITSANDGKSTLVVASADISYIYGGVDVYGLVTGNVGVLLGSDSTVQLCDGKKIYVPSDKSVNIKIVRYK